MSCQHHVLLKNAFGLRSFVENQKRLTMREMEFRDKTAIQQCRDCRVEIIQMWIRKRRNVCKLRHVLSETSIRYVNCVQFLVTFNANNALLTDFFHSPRIISRKSIDVIRVQKRVSQLLSAQRKEKIHYTLPACKHQLKKIAAVSESK